MISQPSFVQTDNLSKVLELLKDALQYNSPILLKGPASCGKTFLLKHVAQISNVHLVTVINMAEQLDPRSLIGSFVASTNTGLGFEWQSGPLVQAMKTGSWLILRDMNLASPEMLSIIKSVLETNKPRLFVPSLGQTIYAHPSFRIFGTFCLNFEQSLVAFNVLSNPLWYQIQVDAPDLKDMYTIASRLYPSATIRFWSWITNTHFTLHLTLRRLRRLCERLEYEADTSITTITFTDQIIFLKSAYDVLFAWESSYQKRIDIVNQIASIILMPVEKAQEIIFGDTRLFEKLLNTSLFPTFLARQTVERLFNASNLSEPTLLVGETGTGKTTLVQNLATILHHRLLVVNLGQQSEGADLIGGLKPVSIVVIAKSLYEKFETCFVSVFSRSKNAEYLEAVREALSTQNWFKFTKLLSNALCLLKQHTNSLSTFYSEELIQFKKMFKHKVSFRHQDGPLSMALKYGHWILLDEINLANPETLNIVASLLREDQPRHPDFRLFACMNPPTDVNKHSLPPNIRSIFTEVFVDETDVNEHDMYRFIELISGLPKLLVKSIIDFYYDLKKTHESPTWLNLRTVSRALQFASSNQKLYGISNALYEGFEMIFMRASQKSLDSIFKKHFHNTLKALPCISNSDSQKIIFDKYVLPRGPLSPITSTLVITPTVQANILRLARAIQFATSPILLEGPTSIGKTSLVQHMALLTGHHFVRINNHEHTDLQEYIGMYVSDPTGQLSFRDGILVRAMRQGHWVVLDELNLAPSDILESLNRLLDDNREFLIPETNEVIRPHPSFMLFATQNPAGSVYGGRKMLSRAFQSRFIEIFMHSLPPFEIETIISQRCSLAPSQAHKILQVYNILTERREALGHIFAGQYSLITLRDLFRWALRNATTNEDIALNGYVVLAERLRDELDRQFLKQTIEQVFKCAIKYHEIPLPLNTLVVWTKSMKRLYFLITQALTNHEPILLVGETGCGKTTICQLIADIFQTPLKVINMHQNSEASDFLGSYRPNRDSNVNDASLFKWVDGPLVTAMKQGHLILFDEISLADDSVLERMNSVLELSQTLVLSEKNEEESVITGQKGFGVLATMNPGGDYGKKELSPALRNRFTEIWVPSLDSDMDDIQNIVKAKITAVNSSNLPLIIGVISEFWKFWISSICTSFSSEALCSMRDIISWITFINCTTHLEWHQAVLHGACLIFVDKIRAKSSEKAYLAMQKLQQLVGYSLMIGSTIISNEAVFGIEPFYLSIQRKVNIQTFSFNAQTTKECLLRVLRALQIPNRAILIEGSPGIGKTALITALAHHLSIPLTRINLSEQTDLSDLFGTDLPVHNGSSGQFRWADGPFLSALKQGHWIILDELNLASQSVLEGLNACLDHRSTVYIPELDKTFEVSTQGTRIFAAQNPVNEGGGRKGLPRSFLNRFSIVWMDPLNEYDYQVIMQDTFGQKINTNTLNEMIEFVRLVNSTLNTRFNLRDLFRWAELVLDDTVQSHHIEHVKMLFMERLKNVSQRTKVIQIAETLFKTSLNLYAPYSIKANTLRIGKHVFNTTNIDSHLLLNSQISVINSLITSIKHNWLVILNGSSGVGKTQSLRIVSDLFGASITEYAIHSEIDTLELLGSFEQTSVLRQIRMVVEEWAAITDDEQAKDALCYLNTCDRQPNELLAFLESISPAEPFAKRLSQISFSSKIRFEWVDGPLVRAMILGHWLVLDNVNLCNASVLDRLNSMFESGGVLTIPEQGLTEEHGTRTIHPHPSFRLFMTANTDQLGGEISRAMRNRSIELYMNNDDIERRMLDGYALTTSIGCKESILQACVISNWHQLRHAGLFTSTPEHVLNIELNELIRFWIPNMPLRFLNTDYTQLLIANFFERIPHEPDNFADNLARKMLLNIDFESTLIDSNKLSLVISLTKHDINSEVFASILDNVETYLKSFDAVDLERAIEVIFGILVQFQQNTSKFPLTSFQRLLHLDPTSNLWIQLWSQNYCRYGFKNAHNIATFMNLLDKSRNDSSTLNINDVENKFESLLNLDKINQKIEIETLKSVLSLESSDSWFNQQVIQLRIFKNISTFRQSIDFWNQGQKDVYFAAHRVFKRIYGSNRFLHDFQSKDLHILLERCIDDVSCLTVCESTCKKTFVDSFLLLLIDYCHLKVPIAIPENDDPRKLIVECSNLITFDPVNEYYRLRHFARLLYNQYEHFDIKYRKLLFALYYGTISVSNRITCFNFSEEIEQYILDRSSDFINIQKIIQRVSLILDKPEQLVVARHALASYSDWFDITTPVIDALDKLIGNMNVFVPIEQYGQLTLVDTNLQTDLASNPWKLLYDYASICALNGCHDIKNEIFAKVVDYLYSLKPTDSLDTKLYQYRDNDEDEADEKVRQELFGCALEEESLISYKNDADLMIEYLWNIISNSNLITTGLNVGSKVIRGGFRSWAWRITALPTMLHNVYEDEATVEQKTECLAVISPLHKALKGLLEEYPDHDVLEILSKQLDRLANLKRVSLINLCLSLEAFCQKATDWQIIAPKQLALDLASVTLLIISWRRIELASWRSLLASVRNKYCQDAIQESLLWIARLTLYSEHFDGSLIDQYILGAPVGQFSQRFAQLRLFDTAKNGRLTSFYSHLEPIIYEYITEVTEPLERELSAHLLTITWNDHTIWALKQSTLRSHRIMARIVRKFRDTLDVPISVILGRRPIPIPKITFTSAIGNHVEYFTQNEVSNRFKDLPKDSAVREASFVGLMKRLHEFGVNLSIRPSSSISTILLLERVNICSHVHSNSLIQSIRSWSTLQLALKTCDKLTARQVQAIECASYSLVEYLITLGYVFTSNEYSLLSMQEPIQIIDHNSLLKYIRALNIALEEYKIMCTRFGLKEHLLLDQVPLVNEWIEYPEWSSFVNLIFGLNIKTSFSAEQTIMMQPISRALKDLKHALSKCQYKLFRQRSLKSLSLSAFKALKNILDLPIITMETHDTKNYLTQVLAFGSKFKSICQKINTRDLLFYRSHDLVTQYSSHSQDIVSFLDEHFESMNQMYSCLIEVFMEVIHKGLVIESKALTQDQSKTKKLSGNSMDSNGSSNNDENKNGDNNIPQGFADGCKGDVDVGNEMEFEEQIQGTKEQEPSKDECTNQDQTTANNQDKDGTDKDDCPIDMRQDFDAQLESLLNADQDESTLPSQPDNPDPLSNKNDTSLNQVPQHENDDMDQQIKDSIGNHDKAQSDVQACDTPLDTTKTDDVEQTEIEVDGVQKENEPSMTEKTALNIKDDQQSDPIENPLDQLYASDHESNEDLNETDYMNDENHIDQDDDNLCTVADDFAVPDPEQEKNGNTEMDNDDMDLFNDKHEGIEDNEPEEEMSKSMEEMIEDEMNTKEDATTTKDVEMKDAGESLLCPHDDQIMTQGTGIDPSTTPYSLESMDQPNIDNSASGEKYEKGTEIEVMIPDTDNKEEQLEQAPKSLKSTDFVNNLNEPTTTTTTRYPEFQKNQFAKNKHMESDGIKQDENVTSFSYSNWLQLEQENTQLAAELAEQLCLHLTPSIASRMGGEFKTGPRLNIRRILPYIASECRRDRIWMRKSKLSKRNYQVVIALDTSKSMTNTPEIIPLALKSLSIITGALSKLEAHSGSGEFGIVTFGQDVRVLVPLGPSSATAMNGGTIFTEQLIEQLASFKDTHTDTHGLVSALPSLFHTESFNRSKRTPHRLALILSDGICERHSEIQSLLTDLYRHHSIMVLFIVLDCRPSNQSITCLSRVEFVDDVNDTKDTGGTNHSKQRQIQIKRYLETFPFEYYMVLKDAQRLPNVLADALKQWIVLES